MDEFKFKLGEKVKVIDSYYDDREAGKIGIVVSREQSIDFSDGERYMDRYSLAFDDKRNHPHDEDELEKVDQNERLSDYE